jgi:hypothetical protein
MLLEAFAVAVYDKVAERRLLPRLPSLRDPEQLQREATRWPGGDKAECLNVTRRVEFAGRECRPAIRLRCARREGVAEEVLQSPVNLREACVQNN